MDLFTKRRLSRFIDEYRKRQGQLPTLRDLEVAGFDKDRVKEAIKEKVIEEYYVTLTNGTIVKGFKNCAD